MKRGLLAMALASLVPMSASAALVHLGTATGGYAVYYNQIDNASASGIGTTDGVVSGYDENPLNQAYTQAQISASNTNGMAFQFDPNQPTSIPGLNWNDIFSGQPAGSSQFGFDFLAVAPTYSNAGGVTIPSVNFYDNTNYTVAGATVTPAIPPSPVAWALNDYKGASPNSPATPGTSPINSLFRGTGVTLDHQNLSEAGGVYTYTFDGWLATDGSIHWYGPATPDTALSNWGYGDSLFFSGTLVYDARQDNDYTKDFYSGSVDLYLATPEPTVPEPATLSLLGLGLAGIGAARRRRKTV